MGKPKSTIQQKVDWLVDHPAVWEGWPQGPISDNAIISLMQKDGLISDGSHKYDVMDFGKLIQKARAQMRKQKSSWRSLLS